MVCSSPDESRPHEAAGALRFTVGGVTDTQQQQLVLLTFTFREKCKIYSRFFTFIRKKLQKRKHDSGFLFRHENIRPSWS